MMNKPLVRAIQALRGAGHQARCWCPYHYAAEYGFDVRAIEAELERRRAIVREQIAALKAEAKLARTKRALELANGMDAGGELGDDQAGTRRRRG